jgi:hypothetical protein
MTRSSSRYSILTQSDEAAGSCQARVVYQSIGDMQFIQQQYSVSEMKNACFRAKPGLVNGTAFGFWFALLIVVSSMRDHACLGALPIPPRPPVLRLDSDSVRDSSNQMTRVERQLANCSNRFKLS